MSNGNGASWPAEYQAVSQIADLARDPDDFRVTRQSKVTIAGLLVPVSGTDSQRLDRLNLHYQAAFRYFRSAGRLPGGFPPLSATLNLPLTSTMMAMVTRAATRSKGEAPDFDHISIDPRDYTIFAAPHVDIPVISIHTRPERCWFLGIIRFDTALGLSLGRMRVMRPTKEGMYPVTIRTKWRALTNKVKQEEVRDAYQRLIQA